MLTLKIVYTDKNSNPTTYLFEAERINHIEFGLEHKKGMAPVLDSLYKQDANLVIANPLVEMDREDDDYILEYSHIVLNGYSDKNETFVLNIGPRSSCYIMSGGQTVDKIYLV